MSFRCVFIDPVELSAIMQACLASISVGSMQGTGGGEDIGLHMGASGAGKSRGIHSLVCEYMNHVVHSSYVVTAKYVKMVAAVTCSGPHAFSGSKTVNLHWTGRHKSVIGCSVLFGRKRCRFR
jgi:hypothetical protein